LGINKSFDRNYRAVYEAINPRVVSTVQFIHLTSRDFSLISVKRLRSYADVIFRETMVHDFDMARWPLGEEIEEVFAHASNLIYINNSFHTFYGHDQRVEVLGSQWIIPLENVCRNKIEQYLSAETKLQKLPCMDTQCYLEAYMAELEHFIEVISGSQKPIANAEYGMRALVCAVAAIESAQSGKQMSVGP